MLLERFFPKREDRYVNKLLSKGLSFPDTIEILWENEGISEKYLETLKASELEILRRNVHGELLEAVKEELTKKGDSFFWAQSCLDNFNDKEHLSFARVMLKGSLQREKAYGECYKFFLRENIEKFSSLSSEKKMFLEEMEESCLHGLFKSNLAFWEWKILFVDVMAIIREFSWFRNFEEINIKNFKDLFKRKIENSSLSFEELIWVRNNVLELKVWALEKLKSTEYE